MAVEGHQLADIFDQFEQNYQGGAAPAGDMFDQLEQGYQASATHSEGRAVLNDALRGAGGFLGFVDELNPIGAEGLKVPHFFGLGPKTDEEPFSQLFERVAKDYGVMTEDKPQTELGKLAGNVAENAAMAAPFGPMAMAANAVFGGVGGYGGEHVGAVMGNPQAGRAFGSFLGGVSPAGISKLGIVKELGESLGPTVSQLPVLRELFGNAPIQAAVGRALTKAAEDPIAAEAALKAAASAMGPVDNLTALKTTAEVAADRGLMRAEDAVQNAIPGAPFKGIAETRAAAREADVLKGYDPTATSYDVSKSLEGAIGESAEALNKVERTAWNAIPKDTPVYTKMPGLDDALKATIDDITYSGALPIEGEAAGLLKKFNDATSEGAVSFDVIQKLRSKALEVSRATASGVNAADRVANKVASTLEEHLRNIIDANVTEGTVPEAVADLWQTARGATREKFTTFGAPKAGLENAGTKGLEQVAIKGQALDNTTLLKEGLNSPDKLASHLQAAAAGGQDVKPLYRQALKSELDGKPQSQWANIIDRKRPQWEMVFGPDEMANLERNLADVEAELVKNRGSVTSGSATNPRGNVQRVLNSEKGLAALSTGAQNATTLLAAGGAAKYGWDKAETTPGGIANALLYGTAGAVFGKAFKGATSRASEKFDSVLVEALKDPRKALSAIEAAKPSELGKAVKAATLQAGVASGAKGAQVGLNSVFSKLFSGESTTEASPQTKPDSAVSQMFTEKESKAMTEGKKDISAKMEDIKPLVTAVIEQESGGKADVVSDAGAVGLMQIMPATGKEIAKKLGVTKYDLKDPETNKRFGTFYLNELLDQFDGNVELALTAYHSGPDRVERLLKVTNGNSLSDIIDLLGPVGQKYARGVLAKLNKRKVMQA